MTKIIYLFLFALTAFQNSLIAMDDMKEELNTGSVSPPAPANLNEQDTSLLSTKSSKIQIQQNPPLWLHIRVDKQSLYKAYANAWVTLGSDENARKYAVESISISLTFKGTTSDTQNNKAEIEISQGTKDKCYSNASASASTTGPHGSVYASTN